MEFKDIIRKKRLLLDLTKAEVTEKVGVSRPTYNNWESGDQLPSKKQKAKLFEVLHLQEFVYDAFDDSFNSTNKLLERLYHEKLRLKLEINVLDKAIMDLSNLSKVDKKGNISVVEEMNKRTCKENKAKEICSQGTICRICYECERYGICDCTKTELKKEKVGVNNG